LLCSAWFLSNNPASSYFEFIQTPENLDPFVRVFVEADRPWAGHISIIATNGIQMLAARRS
jgi:hypothetical protein